MLQNIWSRIKNGNVVYAVTIPLSVCMLFVIYSTMFQAKISKKEVLQDTQSFISNQFTLCENQGKQKSCYKNMAAELANNYSTEDVLTAFLKNENNPKFYEKCHETLHFFGQQNYKNSPKLDELLLKGQAVCFSGYYHGVLEQYFTEKGIDLSGDDDKEINKEVPIICKNILEQKSLRDYHECLHGLGHSLMYATEQDVPRSLSICNSIPKQEDTDWCYTGVFMENSTSSTNKEHPSKYLKAEDPLYPCNILEAKYLPTCYTLQSFYFAEISAYDWNKTAALCLKIPDLYQDKCFNALGQVEVGATSDPKTIYEKCEDLPTPKNQNECVKGSVGALGQRFTNGYENAKEFCGLIPKKFKQPCYEQIADLITIWIKDKSNAENFCQNIADAEYKLLCMKKIQP